jgi:ATP-dependent Clp protease ATP-binding subunit ClpB
MNDVKHHFRPEFINRIDEIVVFHNLTPANIQGIAKIQLQRLAKRLTEQELELNITDAAITAIGQAGFDAAYGARPLKRAISQHIENPLARAILAGHYLPKSVVKVDYVDGGFVFK